MWNILILKYIRFEEYTLWVSYSEQSHSKQADHWRLPRPVNKFPRALNKAVGMPMWSRGANDHDIAHVQAMTVPMILIWSELAQWLVSPQGVHKVSRALIKPVHMPTWSRRSYDHDNAHIRAKMVPVNLICSESTQWLPSCVVRTVLTRQTNGRTNARTERFTPPPPLFFPSKMARDEKSVKFKPKYRYLS